LKTLHLVLTEGNRISMPAGTSLDQWGNETEADVEPIAARRADALVRLVQSQGAGQRNTSGGDRFLVHIHTNTETLKADGTGAQSELEDIGSIAAETTRRLACDAGVVQWLEDAEQNPLSVGRKTRSIPPSIRRALRRRDGGCRFPACSSRHHVDAHHIQHWADGGETSMDNLVLLCSRHHRLVHEGGFGVGRTIEGISFTDSNGSVIPIAAQTRSRGNVSSLFNENDQEGIQITPKTLDCLWTGERMDRQMVVGGMLQLE
jgi:5-methylcytosine-specific restriction endonuclease McrA